MPGDRKRHWRLLRAQPVLQSAPLAVARAPAQAALIRCPGFTRTQTLAAALLLNFGATVGVMIARAGPLNQSPVTYQLAGALIGLGAIGGFLCLYLFYRDEGLLYGFLYWLLSGVGFAVIADRLIDEVRSILGLMAIAAGLVLAVRVFLV
jgi:hypothetical protein